MNLQVNSITNVTSAIQTLSGLESITTLVAIDDSNNELVAAIRDDGVQIINITDPHILH